jgi:UDP-glucose 4-epimerase
VRYIVFGGAGYLGSHLVDQLITKGEDVVVFDNLSGNVRTDFMGQVVKVDGDITRISDLNRLDNLGSFDGVFHLAAKKSVAESIVNPNLYMEVNLRGTRNVLDYCIRSKVKKIVFTSSAAVYGEVESSSSVAENSDTKPINPYGLSKMEAELLIEKACGQQGLSAISLRTFNLAGSRNPAFFDPLGENVLPIIARKLFKKETFTVFGGNHTSQDGTCVRDYTNVDDVARAHLLAMAHLEKLQIGNFRNINISSNVGYSILELISKVNEISGMRLDWNFGEKRNGDPASVIGDNQLANKLIGWSPSIDINQSICETLEGYLQNSQVENMRS